MSPSTEKHRLNRYDKILILIFVLTLPLVNPWVRGDGVGYYAYARAIVVNHNLQFEPDWLHANPSFYMGRIDAPGHLRADQYTRTGHVDNHFTIGPALIWIPFLAATHAAVLAADRLGARVPADGFSWPYIDTMAFITALAGFLGLFLSFRLARKYFPRALGFSRNARHLVRQLFAGLYVFQSVVVARALRIRRCIVPVVLGPHSRGANSGAMARPWPDSRTHARCLLPECFIPSGGACRISIHCDADFLFSGIE